MPLFETFSVDNTLLRSIVKDHWGVELGECVKASQNHTYTATKPSPSNASDKSNAGHEESFFLRVMPDTDKTRLAPTQLEIALLEYLHSNNLPVCHPISSTLTGSCIVQHDNLLICLFTKATGEPVVYTEWKWMEREVVVGLGKWFALLHQLSRKFMKEFPEQAAKARHWKTLHSGVLAEVEVDERDAKTENEGDTQHYGVIHGDVNPSNYFWNPTKENTTDEREKEREGMPCMFDWDQMQSSWYLYDLSAPIWGVITLEKAGSPIDRTQVPSANSKNYTDWLVEGYEANGGGKVDREALQRMVRIRRELYVRFCKKAVLELEDGHGMKSFCQFMVDFFEKEEKDEQK